MARRKAPENETQQEMEVRKAREEISNHATRSEKVSWERQFGNMQKLLEEKLQPIEDEILQLIGKKNKVFDEIVVLRDELVRDCIHPFDHVVATDNAAIYECKFCNKRVAKNDITE
ncbi:hypothetical protein D3C80_1052070 [compost metagenome]